MLRSVLLLSALAAATPAYAGWGLFHHHQVQPGFVGPGGYYGQSGFYGSAFNVVPSAYVHVVPTYALIVEQSERRDSDSGNLVQIDLDQAGSLQQAAAFFAAAAAAAPNQQGKRPQGDQGGQGGGDQTTVRSEVAALRTEVSNLKTSIDQLKAEVSKLTQLGPLPAPGTATPTPRQLQLSSTLKEVLAIEERYPLLTVRTDKQAAEARHAALLDSLKLPVTP